MKAVLFAAGIGTRLRLLTDRVPKCLLPVGGRPLLDIWLDALAQAGVSDVLINLHHLPDLVRAHVTARRGPPRITLTYEPELLGSAGTLRANANFLRGERFFLALYADNLTDFDLSKLIARHQQYDLLATLGLFESDSPQQVGIVEIDEDGLMLSFEEKPKAPRSTLANAGLYALSPAVLDLIHGSAPCDVGYHLLPRLVGKAHGFVIDAYLRDIGTVEAYAMAQVEWLERQGA